MVDKNPPNNAFDVLLAPPEKPGDIIVYENQTFFITKTPQKRRKLLLNFSMTLSNHGFKEDGDRIFIFDCKIKNGKSFYVGLVRSDLDSVQQLIAAIKRTHPESCQIDIWSANKAHLNEFVTNLITEYENDAENQKEAIVAFNPGFYSCNGEDVYVLSHDIIIPISENSSDESVRHLNLVWLGKHTSNLYVGPSLSGNEVKKLLDTLQEYHGENIASIYTMMMGICLTLNRKALDQAGISLPIINVTGEAATGKSKSAEHIRIMMPRIKFPTGDLSVIKDNDMSLSRLKTALTETYRPIILDPVPEISPKETTALMDTVFQSVVKQTSHSRANVELQSSLILIWPNEKAALPDANTTMWSKMVLLKHFNRDGLDKSRMDDIHDEVTSDNGKFSGMFRTLVQRIEPANLKNQIKTCRSAIEVRLNEKFDAELLGKSNRIIDQYALILAAWHFYTEALEIEFDEKRTLYGNLLDAFVRTSIPRNILHFNASLNPDSQCNVEGVVPDDITNAFSNLLSGMPSRNVMELFSFGPTSLIINNNLWKGRFGGESMKLVKCSFNGSDTRGHFLTPDKSIMWFKRGKSQGKGYGTYRKCHGLNVLNENIPDSMKAILKSKVEDYSGIQVGQIGNWKEKLDSHFQDKFKSEDFSTPCKVNSNPGTSNDDEITPRKLAENDTYRNIKKSLRDMSELGMRHVEAMIQDRLQNEQAQKDSELGVRNSENISDNEDIFSEVEKEIKTGGGKEDSLEEGEQANITDDNEDKNVVEVELAVDEVDRIDDGGNMDTEAIKSNRPRVLVVFPEAQEMIVDLEGLVQKSKKTSTKDRQVGKRGRGDDDGQSNQPRKRGRRGRPKKNCRKRCY